MMDGVVSDVIISRKDGGLAWLVCLASFWVHGAVFGIITASAYSTQSYTISLQTRHGPPSTLH